MFIVWGGIGIMRQLNLKFVDSELARLIFITVIYILFCILLYWSLFKILNEPFQSLISGTAEIDDEDFRETISTIAQVIQSTWGIYVAACVGGFGAFAALLGYQFLSRQESSNIFSQISEAQEQVHVYNAILLSLIDDFSNTKKSDFLDNTQSSPDDINHRKISIGESKMISNSRKQITDIINTLFPKKPEEEFKSDPSFSGTFTTIMNLIYSENNKFCPSSSKFEKFFKAFDKNPLVHSALYQHAWNYTTFSKELRTTFDTAYEALYKQVKAEAPENASSQPGSSSESQETAFRPSEYELGPDEADIRKFIFDNPLNLSPNNKLNFVTRMPLGHPNHQNNKKYKNILGLEVCGLLITQNKAFMIEVKGRKNDLPFKLFLNLGAILILRLYATAPIKSRLSEVLSELYPGRQRVILKASRPDHPAFYEFVRCLTLLKAWDFIYIKSEKDRKWKRLSSIGFMARRDFLKRVENQ